MAFTTIQGSGANDATSFVGSAGVDSVFIQNVDGPVFLGAQAADDVAQFTSFTGVSAGYTLKGGQGNDTLASAGSTLTNGLVNGNANADNINLFAVSTATVFGGQGADNIVTGNLFTATVNGNKDADTINLPSATNSFIYGGQGNDTLTAGGAGTVLSQSVLQGDLDNDTINLTGGLNIVNSTINGNAGNDQIIQPAAAALGGFTGSTLYGGQGNDTINIAQAGAATDAALYISGDEGNDQLTGGGAADTIVGGEGNDIIATGIGNNSASGGSGVDNLTGGAGNDTLSGGAGADQITTNGGSDRIIQALGDSVAASATWTAIGAGTAAGSLDEDVSVITFANGVDLVTDFTPGTSRLATVAAGGTEIVGDVTVVTTLAAGQYWVQGDWNAATNQFLVNSSAGADALFLITTGTGLATATNNGTTSIVLQGGGALAAADIIAA